MRIIAPESDDAYSYLSMTAVDLSGNPMIEGEYKLDSRLRSLTCEDKVCLEYRIQFTFSSSLISTTICYHKISQTRMRIKASFEFILQSKRILKVSDDKISDIIVTYHLPEDKEITLDQINCRFAVAQSLETYYRDVTYDRFGDVVTEFAETSAPVATETEEVVETEEVIEPEVVVEPEVSVTISLLKTGSCLFVYQYQIV